MGTGRSSDVHDRSGSSCDGAGWNGHLDGDYYGAIRSGFSAPVTLCYWCGTKPGTPGVSVTFNPPSSVPGSTTVATIAVGGGVVPGSYVLPIGGTAAAGSGMVYGTNAITVNAGSGAPSFTLSAIPATTVPAGHDYSAYTTVVVTPQNGFNSAVKISGVGLPSGLQTGGSSHYPYANAYTIPLSLIMSTNQTMTPGIYTISISGTGGGVTATASFPLTITPLAQGLNTEILFDEHSTAPRRQGVGNGAY